MYASVLKLELLNSAVQKQMLYVQHVSRDSPSLRLGGLWELVLYIFLNFWYEWMTVTNLKAILSDSKASYRCSWQRSFTLLSLEH